MKSAAGLKAFMEEWKSGMDRTPLHIHASLMNCFGKVIFLPFYNELKFHILSRDGKMLRLSLIIKISISSKGGHSTFLLSTIDVEYVQYYSMCLPVLLFQPGSSDLWLL